MGRKILMDNNHDDLIQREKSIRDKVSTLEGLHKTCQLSAIGISEPILNESRYLARALADVLFHDRGSEHYLKALQNAEHAASCAINDAVDILIAFVKSSLTRISKDYSTYCLATSSFGEQYVNALEAMEQIGDKVVTSRQSREDRDSIYSELAEKKNELTVISNFALALPRIEAIAKRNHFDQFQLEQGTDHNDKWVAEKLVEALGQESETSILSLAFQPKYQAKENGNYFCIGAETLTRFHVGNSAISPSKFIPVAEETGLISGIGEFALRGTLEALRDYPEIQSISVNVSAIELLDSAYSSNVITIVNEILGDASGRLELEITESAAINDLESFHHLEKLAKAGIRIAIDDFGTGLTRFDYLANVDIKTLKIDQSLVRAFNRAPDTYRKLLRAISAVGTHCGLDVIGEGVESGTDVANLVGEIGLKKFQGFHFGKPLPIKDFFLQNTCFE
jgi:EAL domain-containing protein (putative c-di-GMP-specific phosphodiesterase class I)